MSKYERIVYWPEGAKRARSVILRTPKTCGSFTTGIEVDRTGDEVAPPGVDERRHIIANALITRRQPMAMDLHYGILVSVSMRLMERGTS